MTARHNQDEIVFHSRAYAIPRPAPTRARENILALDYPAEYGRVSDDDPGARKSPKVRTHKSKLELTSEKRRTVEVEYGTGASAEQQHNKAQRNHTDSDSQLQAATPPSLPLVPPSSSESTAQATQNHTQAVTRRSSFGTPTKKERVVRRHKSAEHEGALNGQTHRVDSAELQISQLVRSSEFQKLSKDELVYKLEQALLLEQQRGVEVQAQLDRYKQDLKSGIQYSSSLNDEVARLSQSGKEAQVQCDKARKDCDNLKKHISAMGQTYRAGEKNYDNIAEMKSLKDQVTSLQSRDEELQKAYRGVQQQNEELELKLRHTRRVYKERSDEHEAQHKAFQAELRESRETTIAEMNGIREKHQKEINALMSQRSDERKVQQQEFEQEKRKLGESKTAMQQIEAATLERLLEDNKKGAMNMASYLNEKSRRYLDDISSSVNFHFQGIRQGLEVELENRKAAIEQVAGETPSEGEKDKDKPPRSSRQGDMRSKAQSGITGQGK